MIDVFGLAQHTHKFAVGQHGVSSTVGQAVFNVLGNSCGKGVVFAEAFPAGEEELCAQLVLQQEIDLIKINPCCTGRTAALSGHYTGVDEFQHVQHGYRLQLTAQTLNVEADQPVGHVHIGGLGKHGQTAVYIDFQGQGNLLGAFQGLLLQVFPKVMQCGTITLVVGLHIGSVDVS